MFNTLQAFYKSTEWKKCMAYIKSERVDESGLNICEHCGQPIVKAYDCIGHHKTPLTINNVNTEISLDPRNIVLVHFKCHNIIHNRFNLYQPQRVIIVHGSPLSGKTTFVKQNKTDRDLVVDMDSIWSAITLEALYIKNDCLKTNVFEIRNALMEQIRIRKGQWATAWVIGSYPKRGERERLADRLCAELIYIDTAQSECLERLGRTKDRDYNQWESYITNYFESFS